MSENVTPAADDVRADLEAVLAEVEKSAPAEKARSAAPPPPKAGRESEEEAVGEELVPPEPTRPRDQFGRYAKTPDATAEAPSDKDEEPAEQPDSDQPVNAADEPAKLEGGSPAIAPPQSWSAAARDEWTKLPRAIQDEVLKRESEVDQGFRQRAEQINGLQPIAQVMQPYAQKFALRGVNPAAAVQQLLAVQDLLERDPIEGVAYVARSYGVDLRSFAAALQQNSPPVDPQVQAATSRIDRMEQFLQQQQAFQQQADMARITQDIEAFRADTAAHPYFDAVRPAMAQLMQQNIELSLQDAYDHAVWAIPEIRARILDDRKRTEQQSRLSAEKQAAIRARRAAVSVASAPASGKAGSPAKDEGVRETIERVMEQAASR